jgi:peptide/nickel transport system substrate-binding protein
LCIDLPRDVDAATGGNGAPVYGPVAPDTWAYDPALPKPARDTAAARKLIEGAGWQPGSDGVYAKDGVRLAATIPVRKDSPERVKIVDLIASQARDCGMDLRSLPTDFSSGIWPMLNEYPHNTPGTKTPFDLFIVAWTGDADPGSLSMFTLSNISDAKHPDAANTGGFRDPALDRLIEAAMSTYDQVERASLYRQVQQELAAQLPYIFLWAASNYDVVRSAVTSVDGPLDLTAPYWAWQPERMVVAATAP